MSIELTVEQRQAIAESAETPPRVIDPDTKTTYVLVRADAYERLRGLLDSDFDQREAYPAIDRAFSEGWNDPLMDDYDRYEELKQ
jgi:hypothetical protein